MTSQMETSMTKFIRVRIDLGHLDAKIRALVPHFGPNGDGPVHVYLDPVQARVANSSNSALIASALEAKCASR